MDSNSSRYWPNFKRSNLASALLGNRRSSKSMLERQQLQHYPLVWIRWQPLERYTGLDGYISNGNNQSVLNFKWTITISHMIQVVLKKGQEHSTVMPGNANVDAGTKSDTTRPGSYDKGLIALCHCHHWHHHHHWNHLPVKPGQEVNFIQNFRRSVFVQIFQQSPGPKKIQKRVDGMVSLIKIQFHLPCTLLHNGQCTCIC